MDVTKAFGFIIVLAFLDTISGQSIQQCTTDYYKSAAQITDKNEFCDFTKTYLRCVVSYYRDNGITWTSSQRSQLKKETEQDFSQLNLQCDESVEEMIRFAESGTLPDSEEGTTQSIVDELRSTTDTISGQSIQQCKTDYFKSVIQITDKNEFCDFTKTYLRCVASYYRDNGITWTSSQRSQLKKVTEQDFSQLNLQCDESVEEMIRFAESGTLPDSEEGTTQSIVDELRSTTGTISGQSIQQCTTDYYKSATQITDKNEFCDFTKTYLRCVVSYYRDNGITWTSSQRSQLKKETEQGFSHLNLQCDESVEEMIRFAESGTLPDSEEGTTQSIVDELRSTTDTISGQSIQQCKTDYFKSVIQITDKNEFCDFTKTYLRCVASYYRDNGITWTSSQRSQLKKVTEQDFSQLNLQCDESVEEMIRFAESGSGSG